MVPKGRPEHSKKHPQNDPKTLKMALPPRREHQNAECEKSRLTVTKGLPKIPAGIRIEAKSVQKNSTSVSKDASWTARLSQRPPDHCRNECFAKWERHFAKTQKTLRSMPGNTKQPPLQAPRCARRPRRPSKRAQGHRNGAQRAPKTLQKATPNDPRNGAKTEKKLKI